MKKINHIKTNLIALILTLFVLSSAISQDIFDKYSDSDKVSFVSMKPAMFKLLAKIDIDTDDPETKAYMDMVHSITGFKTLATSDRAIALDVTKWVKGRASKLEELMEVKDDGVVMTFYVKQGRDEDHVSELLMFVDGVGSLTKQADINVNGKKRSIDTVVISLTGDIDLNQISKLTSKMNLPGGDALNNSNKK